MKQATFDDLSRGKQLDLLRDVQIPSTIVGGQRVAASTLKATIKEIAGFARGPGECYASHRTLAGAVSCSPITIRRAIDALVQLSLITREKKKSRAGVVVNHYRVVWSEVQLLASKANEHMLSEERADALSDTSICSLSNEHTLFESVPIEAQEEAQKQTQRKPASAGSGEASSPAPSRPLDVVMTFPVVGPKGPVWHLLPSQVDRFRELYPTVDVVQACRNALGWLEGNPERRKTYDGMLKYLHKWLAKDQNQGRWLENSQAPGKYRAPDSAMNYDPKASERNPKRGCM